MANRTTRARDPEEPLGGKRVKKNPPKALPNTRNPRPRARSEEAARASEQVKQRVWHIAELMAGGEWRPTLIRLLAKQWGVNAVTVRSYSAEAKRLVELTTDDRTKLVALAEVKLRKWIGEDNVKDRVQAVRTLLEHLGELRQNVTVSTPNPTADWTDDELERFIQTGERPKRADGADQR